MRGFERNCFHIVHNSMVGRTITASSSIFGCLIHKGFKFKTVIAPYVLCHMRIGLFLDFDFSSLSALNYHSFGTYMEF